MTADLLLTFAEWAVVVGGLWWATRVVDSWLDWWWGEQREEDE